MTVDLLYGADNAYAHAVAGSVRTAVDNTSRLRDLRIFVFDGGFKPKSVERMLDSWPRELNVQFITFPPWMLRLFPTAKTFDHQHTSPATWLRVGATALLPPDVERLGYIDSDTAWLGAPEDLLSVDLHGMPVAWALDDEPTFAKPGKGNLLITDGGRVYGGELPYYNAGVMVWDVPQLRAENLTEELFAFIKRHPGELPYRDQDAFNVWFAGRSAKLDPEWNNWLFAKLDREGRTEEARALLSKGGILHFPGPKPWTPAYEGEAGREFWLGVEARTAWAAPRVLGEAVEAQRLGLVV